MSTPIATELKTYLIRAVVVLFGVALVEVGDGDPRHGDVGSEWQLGITDRLLQDGLQVLLGGSFDVGQVDHNLVRKVDAVGSYLCIFIICMSSISLCLVLVNV